MENAILIAQVISPMYLLVGISIIFNQEFYKKMFLEIAQSKLISYMSGILKFVGGIIILQLYNSRNLNWGLSITIMGWLIVISTAIYIVYPKMLNSIVKPFAKKGLGWLGAVAFLFGLFFLYFGYLN